MRRIRNSKICPILSAKLTSQSNEKLPIIIMSKNKRSNKLNNLIFNMSGRIRKELPLIEGIACNLTTNSIYKLAEDPDVEYISFDSKVFALLDIATASVNGNIPHDSGYLGEDITVAVIDTGVVPHKDLTQPINRIVGFKDLINNSSRPYDDNGHGTHVAGIIAGNGYSSNGKYAGIAPKANILAVKALDESGSGDTSDIISALSWIVENKDKYNTKIINLSVGSPANNPCSIDPLCRAVNQAVKSGITVVVAAGNSGPSSQTILSPGISPSVITVGAVDDKRTIDTADDTIASFSSRGPTREGLIKPDIVAPGVNIVSLSNKNLGGYKPLSGTSMAAPIVSGSIALILNKYGNIHPREIKNLLKKSCIDLNQGKENQGYGMINLEKLFYENKNIDEDINENIHENIDYSYKKNPLKNIPNHNQKNTLHYGYNNFIEYILILFLVLFLLDTK